MDIIECINDDEASFEVSHKGWLVNMLPSTRMFQVDDKVAQERACLEMFFLRPNGKRFSAYIAHEPYFYVIPRSTRMKECKIALERKFESQLLRCEAFELEDLDATNHLSFKRKANPTGNALKLVFKTVSDLMQVRKVLLPLIFKNQAGSKLSEAYSNADMVSDMMGAGSNGFRSKSRAFTGGNVLDDFTDEDGTAMSKSAAGKGRVGAKPQQQDALSDLIDIREYDVPYYQRVCIDLNINAGCWYEVKRDLRRGCTAKKLDMVEKAEPVVLAFDIECTKAPLKFPDPSVDQIFMISYMVGKVGYLIINRTIVSSDIPDFEYNPKDEFPGPFQVFNEADERATIMRFFDEIKLHDPSVFVTYNGDSFDFPFVEARAAVHGLSMEKEIGIARIQAPGASTTQPSQPQKGKTGNNRLELADKDAEEKEEGDDEEEDESPVGTNNIFSGAGGEYRGRSSVHIDCLYWVKRDSYLPAGSRSLKAVTKAKLGYDPVEVDPEDMVRLARERPEYMASYSVSDAVSTFYLYDKYIHLFVFSLCTIIPLGSEDVLRKGSGTLCESLLMVEAFNKRIICPNKQVEKWDKFYQGRLIDSETYVGGHVECLESGVFREDIPIPFDLDPTAFTELMEKIDRDLTFAIEVEGGKSVDTCTNYDKVRAEIVSKLQEMQDKPRRFERPSIYHLDVGAMYPNIILTNRLQPCAVVDDSICAACDFNRADSDCKREMAWEWRGEIFPASKGEFNQIVTQLEYETVDGKPFRELGRQEKAKAIKSRLKDYCQVAFKRTRDTVQELRKATICQRENPFYVDTVRAFRDRRNLYKAESKKWSKKARASASPLDKADCETKVLLFDSLQLAHKCILNSFYGYVMRKGARWHSMEMAAVVTKTGSDLIKQARVLVERVGKPLELDTDGIWCVLPQTFPENFTFDFGDGSSHSISYPCVMLNADVHAKFTNHQYQDLIANKNEYEKRSECSIFFEVDGPYRCMVLPASQEEGKLLKKRYAVFNKNGTLAELKGFELKRRGELKIVKHFQAQVFEKFLNGTSLEECYKAVGEIANFWLDVLYSKGRNLSDEEVIELISENRSMSRSLAEYGEQKSTSITTARRLAEFLGAEMVREKGLACQLLIASKPAGAPTTDRAVPTLIFSADPQTRDSCLRRWLKDSSVSNMDVRDVIDWDYYIDRLGKTIQKIVTIPAALQKIDNPVPRVAHPDWLARVVREKFNSKKQTKIDNMFRKAGPKSTVVVKEDADDDETQMVIENNESKKKKKSNDDDQKREDVVMVDLVAVGGEQAVHGATGFVAFDEWLKLRKQQWRQRWGANHHKRQMLMPTSSSSSNNNNNNNNKRSEAKSIAKMAQEEKSRMETEVLQVLEVREDLQDAGVLSMFVLGEQTGTLRELRVRVPRVFYYDSRLDNEDDVPLPAAMTRRVRIGKHFLPRSRPSFNLFKVEVDEQLFRANSKDLINFLTRPEVEGVYEMNFSLTSRAVCDLSSFIRLRSSAINSRRTIAFDDLEKVDSSQAREYLSQSNITRAFIYHSGVRERQILALFFVDEDHPFTPNGGSSELDAIHLPKRASSVHVWFSGGEERFSLEKLFADVLKRISSDVDPETISQLGPSTVQTVHSADAMWRECGEIVLDKLRDRTRRGPLVMMAQSHLGKMRVLDKLGVKEENLCAIEMPADAYDFPSLQWRRLAAKRALEKYLAHSNWFMERLSSARFASVPIANVGEDHFVALADTLFARDLRFNKNILWASYSGQPDLGNCWGGGGDSDVSSLIVESEFENPAVSFPGAYRSFCVELDMSQLAISAVLMADKVNEIDVFGGPGKQVTTSGPKDLNTTSGSYHQKWTSAHGDVQRAFKCLRGLTLRWFKIASESPEPEARITAGNLIVHMYRWLSSSKSFLRDPALHRYVHNLMTKLFYLLLGEVRALGGDVVYASFEKMIICTHRADFSSAEDWTSHLLKTLGEKELFHQLSLTPSSYWRQLLFMDSFNQGGLRVDRASPDRLDRVLDNWNIIQYLPAQLQEFVRLMVGEFLYKPAKKLMSLHNTANGSDSQATTDSQQQQPQETKTDEPGAGVDDEEIMDPIDRELDMFVRHLVAVEFSQRLLKFIPLVLAAHSELVFPQLPGSHLNLTNPSLEVVKTVCAILSLDSRVKETVRVMKRQALKTLHVMEFAPEAQFQNPALSLVLPDVICPHCNFCEDLDLCRDPRMVLTARSGTDEDEDEEADVDGMETEKELRADWTCPKCAMGYDKSQVESALCELIHRRSIVFQLQDMICPKCRAVRCDNLSQYCACSGKWVYAQMSPREFQVQLLPFERVAEYHEFEWLDEAVEWASKGPWKKDAEKGDVQTADDGEEEKKESPNLAQLEYGVYT